MDGTAIETYLPLFQFVFFIAGWVACCITGLLVIQINR